MKLTNQDIWLAYPSLKQLSQITLPLDVSLGIARQIKLLQFPYATIEHERKELISKYGIQKDSQVIVDVSSPHAGDFALEFGNLLIEYWDEDIEIERVALPNKVESVCEECGHKTEVVFLVEPNILVPLYRYFISSS